MPFLDSNLVFCEDEAITADGKYGDDLDLETNGAADTQLGYVYWNVQVDDDATDNQAGTLELVTGDNSDLETGSRIVVSLGGDENPLGENDLKKGQVFSVQVPLRKCDKYVGVWWENDGSNVVGLKITSWLGMEPVGDLKIQKEP